MRFSLAVGFALMSCETPAELGPCNDVCDVLFDQCQGSCAHADENGADVAGYADCLTGVDECNTYDIVGCENDFGW